MFDTLLTEFTSAVTLTSTVAGQETTTSIIEASKTYTSEVPLTTTATVTVTATVITGTTIPTAPTITPTSDMVIASQVSETCSLWKGVGRSNKVNGYQSLLLLRYGATY